MQDYPESGLEYLRLIRNQKRNILSLEEERREFQARCYTVSSPALDHEKVSGGEVHGLETKVEKLEEYSRKIDEEYEELLGNALEARELIGMVPGEENRMYLREYYLIQHSYNKIAQIVHAAKSQVRDGVKRGESAFNEVYARLLKDGYFEKGERHKRK